MMIIIDLVSTTDPLNARSTTSSNTGPKPTSLTGVLTQERCRWIRLKIRRLNDAITFFSFIQAKIVATVNKTSAFNDSNRTSHAAVKRSERSRTHHSERNITFGSILNHANYKNCFNFLKSFFCLTKFFHRCPHLER